MTGEYLAKVFHPLFKVAAFANPVYIIKFTENTAVNRGAIFQVFSDEQSAIQWLMEGADKGTEAF